MSRYVVGIDLGTTNSALAYADGAEAVEGADPHSPPLHYSGCRRRRSGRPSGLAILPVPVE